MKRFFAAAKGFTLIELLIVVAIIAILAAIAIPNFLEAQVRSKVSRTKSDMRTLATAIESYYVDKNSYPPCNSFAVGGNNSTIPSPDNGNNNYPVLENLSTPIAYLTTGILPDPFIAKSRTGSVYTGAGAQPGMTGSYSATPEHAFYHSYQYTSSTINSRAIVSGASASSTQPVKAIAWVLASAGPDNIYINQGGLVANNGDSLDSRPVADKVAYCSNLVYDPTNGTISFGDVYRVGGSISADYGHYFYQTVGQGSMK